MIDLGIESCAAIVKSVDEKNYCLKPHLNLSKLLFGLFCRRIDAAYFSRQAIKRLRTMKVFYKSA